MAKLKPLEGRAREVLEALIHYHQACDHLPSIARLAVLLGHQCPQPIGGCSVEDEIGRTVLALRRGGYVEYAEGTFKRRILFDADGDPYPTRVQLCSRITEMESQLQALTIGPSPRQNGESVEGRGWSAAVHNAAHGDGGVETSVAGAAVQTLAPHAAQIPSPPESCTAPRAEAELNVEFSAADRKELDDLADYPALFSESERVALIQLGRKALNYANAADEKIAALADEVRILRAELAGARYAAQKLELESGELRRNLAAAEADRDRISGKCDHLEGLLATQIAKNERLESVAGADR